MKNTTTKSFILSSIPFNIYGTKTVIIKSILSISIIGLYVIDLDYWWRNGLLIADNSSSLFQRVFYTLFYCVLYSFLTEIIYWVYDSIYSETKVEEKRSSYKYVMGYLESAIIVLFSFFVYNLIANNMAFEWIGNTYRVDQGIYNIITGYFLSIILVICIGVFISIYQNYKSKKTEIKFQSDDINFEVFYESKHIYSIVDKDTKVFIQKNGSKYMVKNVSINKYSNVDIELILSIIPGKSMLIFYSEEGRVIDLFKC